MEPVTFGELEQVSGGFHLNNTGISVYNVSVTRLQAEQNNVNLSALSHVTQSNTILFVQPS